MGLEFAGKTFGGYRIGDLLDSGPHGVLHAAEHTSSGDKVAIKIFAADLSRDKNAASRLISDVQRAVAVTHPNIIAVREVGTAEFKGKRHLFVAMERLQGESLKSLLAKQKGQPLPLRQVLHIVSELGAALDAIHRNNGVHRLLQASAVFLAPADRDSDESRVIVLDLGASLVPTGDDKKAKAGGKPQDDLRALAQLAVDMLTGAETANDGSQAILPLRLRNRAVPARMDAVLRSVLGDTLGTGDKASRYDSAAAFVAALLGTGETQPRFGSWSEDGRTFPAPKKSHGTLLWAGLFAVAGGLALGYHLFTSEPGTPAGGGQPANPPTQAADLGGLGPAGAGLHAADAGGDAGSAPLGGPGHWPQRPGGKIPDVRAADAWPVQNVAPVPGPTPPGTANSGTAGKEAPASGAQALPAKPPVATQPSPPSAAPGAAASPTGGGSTPAAKPAAPTTGPAPTAAAKPTAGSASPAGSGGTAGASGSVGGAPAAKPVSSPVSPSPAAKPVGAAATGNTATAPAAKPAAPATTGGPAAAQGAKPAAQIPSGAVGGTVSAAAGAKPAAAPVATGPAAKPAAAPAGTGPAATAAGAKPAAGSVGTAPAAGGTTPRSPSAPAAPAGASSAAKTPETRPSSTGGSAPAAKPATSSGGSSGPQ